MATKSNPKYTNAMFVILGIPTWTLVDGTWSMLSQLANTLPEGYKISSYLILSLTLGNLVPLTLGILLQNSTAFAIKQIIYGILVIGFIAGILMSIFWQTSIPLAHSDSRFSFPLYALFFVVGACSSASNVTHFTFVSKYEAISTSALATGMGIGSMISGFLAILQGTILDDKGFSVSNNYVVLSILYIPAIVALYFIDNQSESAENSDKTGDELNAVELQQKQSQKSASCCDKISSLSHSTSISSDNSNGSDSDANKESLIDIEQNSKDSRGLVGYSEREFLTDHSAVLLIQFANSFLGYGLIPSIASLACYKFNNSSLVLLLATSLTAVIDPSLRALTVLVRIKTVAGLQLSALCLLIITAGLLLCTVLPASLSLYKGNGGVFPVMLYVSFFALFGYSNTCVYRYFKDNIHPECIHHSYRWGGIATQSGALVGSLLAFILVITNTLG